MGPISASSCTNSGEFALSFHWLTEQQTENKFISHYFDDFRFCGTKKLLICENTMGPFKLLCEDLKIPKTVDKRAWPTTKLVFPGTELWNNNYDHSITIIKER